ncbi:MAG: hypothetical protein J0L88_03695 [Xanthomonadales bacterium]|nr:hypothetical protein [Xanthomonadales bacterium]
MNLTRWATALAAVLAVAACSREQPSALPAPPPATAPAAAPVASASPAPVEAAPPPLSERIVASETDAPVAPFASTSFAVCDEYFEKARQCINTRMNPDDRKVIGTELRNSVRLVTASVQGGSEHARIEQNCKRLRAVSARQLSKFGCTDI